MIYEPKEDSYLLADQIKKISNNKKVLDMGSASGIISETALKYKAKSVLAIDIQSDVIKHLKKKKIPCILSDLFDNIPLKKYDIIAFNPPYLPKDNREDIESQIATTGGEKGDEIILRFLDKVSKYLSKNGIILIILSSLTPKNRIIPLLRKLRFKYKIISHKKIFFERLELWEIKNNNQ